MLVLTKINWKIKRLYEDDIARVGWGWVFFLNKKIKLLVGEIFIIIVFFLL